MFKAFSIAVFLTLLCMGYANADSASSEFASPPNIDAWTARGNLERYLLVLPSEDLEAKVRVVGDAGVFGRITEVHAWLSIDGGGIVSRDGRAWGYSKTYSSPRPKEIDSTVDVRIPADKVRQHMLDACHAQIIRLRKEGMSDEDIWAEDRELDFGITVNYSVGFNGPDTYWKTPFIFGPVFSAKLTCLKHTPSDTPAIGGVATVLCPEKAVPVSYVGAEQITGLMTGVCTLVVRYAIRTSCPNMDVKFRLWEMIRNRKSEVISVTSNNIRLAGGTKVYEVGDLDSGKIRLEGVSPGFLSGHTEYTMDCPDGAAEGGFTVGGTAQGSTFGKLVEDLPEYDSQVGRKSTR
jgi:hypothetical protein